MQFKNLKKFDFKGLFNVVSYLEEKINKMEINFTFPIATDSAIF